VAARTETNRVKELREERRMSQRELSIAADVTIGTVWAIENGQTKPTLQTALSLARALQVPVEGLFPSNDVTQEVTETPAASTPTAPRKGGGELA